MKIFCLSDNADTKNGLRLAGIQGEITQTEPEFTAALNKSLADRDVGILLITEKLAKEFYGLISEIKLERTLPLIVEIPDRHGSGRSGEFITDYVRSAIGLKL